MPETNTPQPDTSHQYDESKIQTLEALEHIRLRSGMYIGRLGNGDQYEDGIYVLLKEIIDNSVDEYIMGNGKCIEIRLKQNYNDGSQLQFSPVSPGAAQQGAEQHRDGARPTDKNESDQSNPEDPGFHPDESESEEEKERKRKRKVVDGMVSVRDYGRGIPLGKIVEAVSVINTGAKYNDDVFRFSVGLNGIGTKAVNALSSYFRVCAFRDGQMAEAVFSKGKLQSQNRGATEEADGTYVEFWPDEEIFGSFAFRLEFLQNRAFHYGCLNPKLELVLQVADRDERYLSRNGLRDLLEGELPSGTLYGIMRCESPAESAAKQGAESAEQTEHPELEFAFTHTQQIGETHFSFVNGQYTVDGGAHLQAFREGFTRGINDYYKTSYTSQDIRDGLVAAVKVKIKNPIFESQTKNKLGNMELRGPIAAQVRKMTADLLYRNEDLAQKLSEKIRQNEKLRKELSGVRKMMRESNRRLALNIPQLRDCKYHLGDKMPRKSKKSDQGDKPTMIFLTEGQSATGSLVSCRDVHYQALFSLRGKPWNCFGRSTAEIYQNEELFHLLKALGLENGTERLRYDQIILATDADDDGYHIRNLLMTFFLHYFEEMVQAGHLYILETPLFRVRNSKETHYCYNEDERNHWIKKLSNPEITRFKGLGEISPKEFGQFIGEDIRLIPVNIEPFKMHFIPEVLEFYMGKNTPRRKQFIMENLKDSAELT
ncbi:toprim domain-containing protein [Candidatus Haliotispira prima]|uniref:DNA topoisomerase (ATP-hydrolyzing) n=1 Tax=Candidatus Haliotispira prima TaxID=3034016 RepID=A0ABY8MLX0_9SPIO|nr:toprim domain-containing protein [Candidatus Haliotispira prima]